MMLTRQEKIKLMEIPEFRKFLFTAIQMSGMFSAANGQSTRDLNWIEGRRSLGLEILTSMDEAQPKPMRHPNAVGTLHAIINEQLKEPVKERQDADRYDDVRS